MKLSKPWLVRVALISADSKMIKMLVLFWLSNENMEIPHHSPFSWALCLGNRWVAKRSFQRKVYSNTEFTPREKHVETNYSNDSGSSIIASTCKNATSKNVEVDLPKTGVSCHEKSTQLQKKMLKLKDLPSLKLTIRP